MIIYRISIVLQFAYNYLFSIIFAKLLITFVSFVDYWSFCLFFIVFLVHALFLQHLYRQ